MSYLLWRLWRHCPCIYIYLLGVEVPSLNFEPPKKISEVLAQGPIRCRCAQAVIVSLDKRMKKLCVRSSDLSVGILNGA